ncbi:uncharacterized protein MYCFIDRAFT_207456 [Pseudocercospora fijiensis CIRAD86]|uniref:Uncharacterized protein n=1 Tax=Pseudocercospora fijiensis (strain CIRAD86) TaxID=383855 RepID=M2Z5A4_PSEFD|nr:uncharacterized protein MYCFIDRAFT_207456 [Pseudocercospora fijiensis CIRAD86]EME84995.1 hypothetical protein MYCFIDRAFT_207456 [Pseudocercospora fijiensis CIRAD86]
MVEEAFNFRFPVSSFQILADTYKSSPRSVNTKGPESRAGTLPTRVGSQIPIITDSIINAGDSLLGQRNGENFCKINFNMCFFGQTTHREMHDDFKYPYFDSFEVKMLQDCKRLAKADSSFQHIVPPIQRPTRKRWAHEIKLLYSSSSVLFFPGQGDIQSSPRVRDSALAGPQNFCRDRDFHNNTKR